MIERVVLALESTLSQSSRIQRDVLLPVLGRPDREPRQCDIVITMGTPPRATLTIVEVQARKSKPEIGMLAAWVDKMREVGAQHLICVAEAGFPESMVRDVELKYGPTVRLMTLEELTSDKTSTLPFAPTIYVKAPRFWIEGVRGSCKFRPQLSGQVFDITETTRAFSLDDDPLPTTLPEVLGKILDVVDAGIFGAGQEDFQKDIDIGALKVPVWFTVEGRRFRVKKLVVRVRIQSEGVHAPVHVYSYRQELLDGVLAWVGSAEGLVEGRRFDVQLVYTPTVTGFRISVFGNITHLTVATLVKA